MIDVDDIVVKKRKIYIVNGYDNILPRSGFQRVIIVNISGFGNKNASNFLFQNIIDCHLQILVQREIHVISSLCVHMVCRVDHLSHVIDIDGF